MVSANGPSSTTGGFSLRNVVAAVVGFGLQTIGGPTETIAAKELASIPFQKIGVSVHGLRVALPESMTNFPKELVPLP